MATIYPEALPSSIRDDPRRRGECRVYDEFCKQLGADWVVFYSVPWIGTPRPDWRRDDGEADFVVAHPDLGFAVIEVKGGGIRLQNRRWYSVDRAGTRHEIKDPFQQAVRSKHLLLERIRSSRGWRQQAWVRSTHFVIFPDVVDARGDLSLHASKDLIVTGAQLDRLAERLREIMGPGAENQNPQEDGGQLVRLLNDLIARNIFLRNPLAAQIAEEDREVIRLTEAQFDVLHHLKNVRRAAICGCAGSGKTMIAVEKARRSAAEGKRTLLTCYNKPLAEHLQEVASGVEGLEVLTLHALCVKAARATGQDLPVGDDLPQSVYDIDYPDALSRAMSLEKKLRYDTVIVDEGQDMREAWWLAIDDLLVDSRQSTLYVFLDDNQRLYRGTSVPNDLPRFPLNANVRNTRQIVQLIQPLYAGESAIEPRGPAGRSAELVPCTPETAKRELGRVVTRLIHVEGIRPDHIVVLTLGSVAGSNVMGATLPGGRTLGDRRSSSSSVLFDTVRRFKGLEAPVVIIADFCDLDGADAELLYVALSRPRSHLVLLGDRSAIGRIASEGAHR